nr:hypothetical protein 5 [bacterium]
MCIRDRLRKVYPPLLKKPNKYIPSFRYLHSLGITTYEQLKSSEFRDLEGIIFKSDRKDYRISQYKKHYEANYKTHTTRQIIAETTAEKATLIIPFQDDHDIDIEAVKELIDANKNNLRTEHSSYATYFRKLVCLADRIEFGFTKP